MKIEFTKEEMRKLELMCRRYIETMEPQGSLKDLYSRIRDIASWSKEEYDQYQREQWELERAGSKALFG